MQLPLATMHGCNYVFHAYTCIGTYSADLKKMVYLANRQYLPTDSSLRSQAEGFPTNSEDNKPPPAKKRFCDIKKKHRAHDNELLRYKASCINSCTL